MNKKANNLIDMVVACSMDYEASHGHSSVVDSEKKLEKAVDELRKYINNLRPPQKCTDCNYCSSQADELVSMEMYCELEWKPISEKNLHSGIRPVWCPFRENDD